MNLALEYNCFEAIKIVFDDGYDFDCQKLDVSNGISFIGQLFQKFEEVQEQDQGEVYRKIMELVGFISQNVEIQM